MALLIVLASVLVYAAGWVLAARRRYAMTRPYTEPLSCSYTTASIYSHHEHDDRCYQRPGYIFTDTCQAAAGYAALWATAWPVLIPALGAWSLLSRVVMDDGPEAPAELRAKIARLEHDLNIRED